MRTTRVGVIGYGGVGKRLVDFLRADDRFSLAFVFNRSPEALADLPSDVVLPDLAGLKDTGADLVIEAAHPKYVQEWGVEIVRHCDFAPLSVGGLADDSVRNSIIDSAREHGRRLFMLRGVIPAFDTLTATPWSSVTVTFVKHPDWYDFDDFSRLRGDSLLDRNARQVLFHGDALEAAELFPRNVNAMVALGLATGSLEQLDCIVVSDPGASVGLLEIVATAEDGHELTLKRAIPMGHGYLFSSLFQVFDQVHPPATGHVFV